MNIKAIKNVYFTYKLYKINKAVNIIRKEVGRNASIRLGPNSFTVKIPGRKGCIHVSDTFGDTDVLSLAQDFVKVREARRAGILKPVHVSKINL